MDPATQENAAATEQGAAQAAPEQSAPTKSAAETKLEGQLAAAKTKGYKKERDTLTKERDDLRLENGQLKADNERLTQGVVDAKAPAATVATEEPSEEEYIKSLLKRNGLKVAYILPTGPCFSEAHAREYAGAEFDSLTVVTAE